MKYQVVYVRVIDRFIQHRINHARFEFKESEVIFHKENVMFFRHFMAFEYNKSSLMNMYFFSCAV